MMPDAGTQNKLALVYPPLASAWRQVRDEMLSVNKIQLKVTEGLRTFAEQSRVYSLGRSKGPGNKWIISDPKKVVTHARAGQSLHQYGLALDSAFLCDDPYLAGAEYQSLSTPMWMEYGRLCIKYGLTWGGSWKKELVDRPHCEMSYGLSLADLQLLNEEGGIDAVWTRCAHNSLCGRQVV